METAFTDDGQITGVEEFDYDLVERRLAKDLSNPELAKELAGMSEAEIEAALRMFRCLVRWLWQNGMKNPDGLTIRAILCCWIFVEELRPMTLTEMARGFGGRHKQSLGRWMESFKQNFPFIKTPHMRFRATPAKA